MKKFSKIIVLFIFLELVSKYDLDLFLKFSNIPRITELFTYFIIYLDKEYLLNMLLNTLERVLIGTSVGVTLAVVAAISSYFYPKIIGTIFPLINILKPIPLMAFIPVISLLVYKSGTVLMIVTCLSSFLPIVSNMIFRIDNIPKRYVFIVKNISDSKLVQMKILFLPYLIPSIFTDGAVALSSAWMSVITTESLLGLEGIGYYIWNAFSVVNYKEMFIGIIFLILAGVISLKIYKILFEKSFRKYLFEEWYK